MQYALKAIDGYPVYDDPEAIITRLTITDESDILTFQRFSVAPVRTHLRGDAWDLTSLKVFEGIGAYSRLRDMPLASLGRLALKIADFLQYPPLLRRKKLQQIYEELKHLQEAEQVLLDSHKRLPELI